MRTKYEINRKNRRKRLKTYKLDEQSKKNSAKYRKQTMKSSGNFKNGETRQEN